MLARPASMSVHALMLIAPAWSTLVSRWARQLPWRSPSSSPPAALVLRSPFTSLADMARLQFPFLPTFLLRDRFESLNQISRVDCPLLVMTGDRDSIVPPAQSRRL